MVPSSAVKCACCETAAEVFWMGGARPATFSSSFVVKLPAAFRLESVNCGKATCMIAAKMIATPSSIRTTLRYVTVFQATYIPGLALLDTRPANLQTSENMDNFQLRAIIALLGLVMDRGQGRVGLRK